MFDKDPRVQPYPDFIIDDDWYLVEKYGGHLVSQYKIVNDEDAERTKERQLPANVGTAGIPGFPTSRLSLIE